MNEPLTTVAQEDRWRPNRAGLVGLWRYWDETFSFYRGRLLLRGPNGSGKSMALELLLPFLLDGDTSPSKLTSSSKPRGRLFDRVMTGSTEPSRVGFAWVEFVRGTEAFTVGARIRAAQSTGRAEVDFFTTSQRVGSDLHLLDSARGPLSRKALAEAIGLAGRVYDSAMEHRGAVRGTLFPGFSADRYDSVIGALLALRKEKLSQDLDLAKLSDVLSEALPPLDDQDISAVAEGFERLDRRKAELASLESDLHEVRHLARYQRDYARSVVAGTGADVRNAETRRDDVTRRERQAREELEAAEGRARETTAERQAIDQRQEEIRVETDALKDSGAYREGAGLADLRSQAGRLRAHAEAAARRASERRDEHRQATDELQGAAEAKAAAAGNLDNAGRDLHLAGEAVGAVAVTSEAEAVEEPDRSESLLHAWVGARRSAIAEVRKALDAHDAAVTRRRFFDDQFAADEVIVEDRHRALGAARSMASDAAASYATAVRDWAEECQSLGQARLAAALPQPPEDPASVLASVRQVAAEARSEEAVARQVLQDGRGALGDQRAAVEEERARWEGGELVGPEGPGWRSDRTGRPGAPLWRLVDVSPNAAGPDVDGLEAALTATGLLDAWVRPDGGVEIEAGRADVSLGIGAVEGPSLASLLVPVPESAERHGVTAEVVHGVLSSIRLTPTEPTSPEVTTVSDHPSEAEVWVATDGTYRLGNAVGRGPRRPARVLGAPARERYRLARLAELDAELADLDRRQADLDRRQADLDRLRAALDAELDALPSGDAVVEAIRAAEAAEARLGEARDRLETTRRSRREAEESVRASLVQLTAFAARHSLPSDRGHLVQIEADLDRLRAVAVAWCRRRRDLRAATAAEQQARQRAANTETAAAHAATDEGVARNETEEIDRRVATLEASIGAEYADILRRISELDTELKANAGRARNLAGETEALQKKVGELGVKVENATEERAEAETHREGAHRRLVAGLAAFAVDAGVEDFGPLDTATALLVAARSIAVAFDKVDSEAQTVRRLSERVGERLHAAQAALGARVDFDRELAEDGWSVLRTVANGMRRHVTDLAAALGTELAEGRAELAEEEERLFEQTLAGSVRRALADRIRQANALADSINVQLAEIRSVAGGVQVRLRWEVDSEQPDAVKAARSLLLRDPADLSDGERSSLQEFVRARVDQARAELEANAPWEARLRETLDYRAWHRFTLQLAHRDWEGFVPATPRRLQKLSTGERSIALHLPMIASVAAHYVGDKGRPSCCPRLILLDELFAGVDTANRAQLFGTFSTWDLDAVFTSDHEWCQYGSLDGIAIHHLHPPTGDEPVTSTRFTWDGRKRRTGPSAA
ncbi:MAG TPA: TIGR02680 family protein [Acidimicrobiales bacterium]|nr:TIGR02680 family protein [Acidimicrobiales bacterium]